MITRDQRELLVRLLDGPLPITHVEAGAGAAAGRFGLLARGYIELDKRGPHHRYLLAVAGWEWAKELQKGQPMSVTAGELLAVYNQHANELEHAIIRVLVDHPSGLMFGQLQDAIDQRYPPLKGVPFLRKLMDLVCEEKAIIQSPKAPIRETTLYRLAVDDWAIEAVKADTL